MKLVNSELEKKQLTRKVVSVADAVAMNAIPEYWLSFKLAGMHLLAMLSVAKVFLLQLDLNQIANH
jgi:hypothetical protein